MTGKKFGHEGEQIARDYLKAKGYEIVAVNWRKSRFEIDIVARKDEVLAFVEVKTSERDTLGPPQLRVNRAKQRKLAEAASEYIAEISSIPESLRFDVIGILWRKDRDPEITHIESAFVVEEDF